MSYDLSNLSLEDLHELAAKTQKAMEEKRIEHVNMANVIEFKPRTVAQPAQKATEIAEDIGYYIGSIMDGAQIAAFIYKDQAAADMLMLQAHRFLREGISNDHLPFEVRHKCARYLAQTEEDITKWIDFLYD
jgi:hypothetical protein